MQNQLKIAYVVSTSITVCWLSILTCYAQGIDDSTDIKPDQVDEYFAPISNDQENNNISDGINIDGEHKDQRQYDKVLIESKEGEQNENANELKSNSTEIIREEIPDNNEQNSDGFYLRSDDEQVDENNTPAQEKPIIHHNKQEKNKLPASEPNLNKDQTEKVENNSNK